MPANSDQQGGKSGKIHFIESTLFILALMAGFAPKMFSFRTLRESLGTPAPPGRSIGGALKGLTCSPVVGSEPVGSWLLVRRACWCLGTPWPRPHHPAFVLHHTGWGGCLCHSLASTSVQLALSCISCSRLWTVDLKVGTQQRWDRALSP